MASDRLQGILGFTGLVALCSALGYVAWLALTRPDSTLGGSPRREAPGADSVGFVAVAGEGIDLEVVAPDGRRATTAGGVPDAERIAGAVSTVDCPGFAEPDGTESACTASINIPTPGEGDYEIIARSPSPRAVLLNVGWASATESRRGGFDVRVQVTRGASVFEIAVRREGVTQRTEPRALQAP